MINIAVLGYGTVGSGVVEVIKTNSKEISKRIGDGVNIKYILDKRTFDDEEIKDKVVSDFNIILNDDEVSIVVECMGGINPAYEFVKSALLKGKCVCTSNKELVASHGAEFLSISKEKNINFLFEASVGGGIPIIRNINSCMTADKIEEITGILNGTTNYMLSKMYFDGVGYEEVLKEAKEKGYAEANPEADVEGFDACRKIAILSSLISGYQVDYVDIYTEGITKISKEDIIYAKHLGYQLKLLAHSEVDGETMRALVAPFLINENNPLFSVNGVFNAVFVRGNVLGDAMFYGSGAGKLPTASAVVADIVDASKHLHRNIMTMWEEDKLTLSDIGFIKRKFFIRVKGDRKSLERKIIEDFRNVTWIEDLIEGEVGFITEEISENHCRNHINNMDNVLSCIRIGNN